MAISFGLRPKLFVPILAIVSIALVLSSWIIVRTAEHVMLEAGRKQAIASSIIVANSIEDKLHRARSDIQMMSALPEVREAVSFARPGGYSAGRAMRVNSLLQKISDIGGCYDAFYVTDTKGEVMAGTRPESIRVLNIADRPWFQETMAKQATVVSSPFRSDVSGEIVVAVATRCAYLDDSGAIVGSVRVEKIAQTVLERETLPWLTPYVVSTSGLNVGADDKSLLGTRDVSNAAWFRNMLGNDSGLVETVLNGKPATIAYYHLPDTTLYTLAVVDKNYLIDANQDVRDAAWYSLLGALLIVCVMVCVQLHPVIRDIQRLGRYTESVRQGAPDLTTGVSRRDELGVLAGLVEQMVGTLHEFIDRSEESSRAKGDFLARMSHEIRTPMNAIIGIVHLSLKGEPPEHLRRNLLKIDTAARNLLGIINDILDFSKIEAGKMQLEERDFSLNGMLRSVHDIIAGRCQEKGLTLRCSVDPSVPDALRGDSLRLSQICLNLCSNALKFTEEGEIRLMVVSSQEANDILRLHFTVTETGIGMTPEQQHSIFDAFSQADESTTRKFGGTGLGLAICKQLVELMGGAICVASEPGKGSCFSFTVTMRKGMYPPIGMEVANLEFSNEDKNKLSDTTILLVEDNEINQEIAVELLHNLGVGSVMVASTGAEAFELCKERSFALVLMDIQMPVMDGLEATRHIRASATPWGATIPIVAMTANAMIGDREKSLEAGMNDHITKPIMIPELMRVVVQWALRPPAVHETLGWPPTEMLM